MQLGRLIGIGALLLFVLALYAAIGVERSPGEGSSTVIQITIDWYSGTLLSLSVLLLACYFFLRRRTEETKSDS
jgi:hypothetical protein